MSRFYRLVKFIEYRFKAKTKYYLHSPFIFRFYLDILEGKDDEALLNIKQLRENWSKDSSELALEDFGTGNTNTRSVAEIINYVAVRHKYGKVLYRMVKNIKPSDILEIGTSLGLSSAYMALGHPEATLNTLEGSPALSNKAQQLHNELRCSHTTFVTGNFDSRLPETLKNFDKLDLVFFDGNHTKEATLSYFLQCLPKAHADTVFVFDDIYWSEGMTEAWEEIKQHQAVKLTIDIYQFGIVFFKKEKLAKEHFMLQY
ncbi:MAG: class I SAM-dependent methyltransferase [Chitinophagales bacterium]